MKTKLAVLTRYNEMGASSRLRYYLFRHAFEQAGFIPQFYPFFRSPYLKRLYSDGTKSYFMATTALMRRFALLPILPKRLLIEYELLPDIPAKLELKLLQNKSYVLNFDDNVWEKYSGRQHLENKYSALVKNANGIIVASDYLLERIAPMNPNTIKIPTVVDLNAYRATATEKFHRFTVAWIGTPITYCYLEANASSLQAMSQSVDFELLVIAKRSLETKAIPGVNMRFVDWSPETEAQLLQQCHVGIMPLVADSISIGKAAYKLIQYQAAGLPAIASPIGENKIVVKPGITGFLAESPEEWTKALKLLAENPTLRQQMQENALKTAQEYSLQKYSSITTDFLHAALDDTP